MYSLCSKPYTNYTQNLTLQPQNPTLRDKESKRQRVKESKRQREEEWKRGREELSLEGYTVSKSAYHNGETACTSTEKRGLSFLQSLQFFPHPRRYFGFNTSCFWRRNVLYLYRDMGGASAPPFFRHFPFKIGDLEAHPGKICLPLILISLLLI